MDMVIDFKNLRGFIKISKRIWKQMRLVLNFSAFDFWLVYCNNSFNFLDSFLFQPNYQKDHELKSLTIGNTLALNKMLFFFFPVVIILTNDNHGEAGQANPSRWYI